jgi:hypothetical protein
LELPCEQFLFAVAAAVIIWQIARPLYALLVVIVGVAGAIILAWILGEVYRLGIISITANF